MNEKHKIDIGGFEVKFKQTPLKRKARSKEFK